MKILNQPDEMKAAVEGDQLYSPYFILKERTDRLGGCWMSAIGSFMYAKADGKIPFYTQRLKYQNSMVFKPFMELCKKESDLTEEERQQFLKVKEAGYNWIPWGGVRGVAASCCITNKEDNVTHFKNNYKEYFLNFIKKEVEEKKYTLPWSNNENIICVHARLGDIASHADYDGSPYRKYISSLIDSESFAKYNRSKAFPGVFSQVGINIEKLDLILSDLLKENPNKEIHIISVAQGSEKFSELSVPFKLHSGNSEDHDLWLLMNSDIMVIGKSTFPIPAAFCHLGSKILYSEYDLIAAHGLLSKFDKTNNWQAYV